MDCGPGHTDLEERPTECGLGDRALAWETHLELSISASLEPLMKVEKASGGGQPSSPLKKKEKETGGLDRYSSGADPKGRSRVQSTRSPWLQI